MRDVFDYYVSVYATATKLKQGSQNPTPAGNAVKILTNISDLEERVVAQMYKNIGSTIFTASRRAQLVPGVGVIQIPALQKYQRRGLAEHRGRTILDVVKADHEMLFGSHAQYEQHWEFEGPLDRWSHQFTWTATRHAISEEIVLYPLLERYLGEEGRKHAEEDRAIHQRVKELLYKAEGYRTNSPQHRSLLQAARDELWSHHTSEEEVDFPMLEKAIADRDEIGRVASRFERTKLLAPTRAHPGAPNRPPYETLVAFMEMPLDKLKDTFWTFPDDYDFEEANLKH